MTAWRVREELTSIGRDLPDGFDAAKGLRSLFPAKRTAKVAQLKTYRFKEPFSLTTGRYRSTGSVKATGSGKWVLSGTVTASGAELLPVHYTVGFAFMLPVDGYVRSSFASDDLPIHTSTVTREFYVSGQDQWIIDNWPAAFAERAVVKLVVSDDPAEFLRELQIVVGVGILVLISGGSVSVGF